MIFTVPAILRRSEHGLHFELSVCRTKVRFFLGSDRWNAVSEETQSTSVGPSSEIQHSSNRIKKVDKCAT